jgi:hypothetical protein
VRLERLRDAAPGAAHKPRTASPVFRPGLNIVGNLATSGRTGLVDPSGQFIWREVTPDQGQPISGNLYHQGQAYPLTTNPSEPSQVGWNTDTATYLGGPQAAFYQMDDAVNRSAGKLETFDEPSAPSVADAHAPCVSRAHLTRLISAKPVSAIDGSPRARLHAQFNELDYLP